MAFTITDEIVSDDEGKADAGAPTDKAPAAEAPGEAALSFEFALSYAALF